VKVEFAQYENSDAMIKAIVLATKVPKIIKRLYTDK
jgi:hypothetical protein